MAPGTAPPHGHMAPLSHAGRTHVRYGLRRGADPIRPSVCVGPTGRTPEFRYGRVQDDAVLLSNRASKAHMVTPHFRTQPLDGHTLFGSPVGGGPGVAPTMVLSFHTATTASSSPRDRLRLYPLTRRNHREAMRRGRALPTQHDPRACVLQKCQPHHAGNQRTPPSPRPCAGHEAPTALGQP